MPRRIAAIATLALAAACAAGPRAEAADPIQIGFSMPLTGGFAVSGKQALVAMKLWEEDINAKGGLLGRPVELKYYDDQSNPANVPGIYTKLLDVDHVELVVSPYGTVLTAPAMPVVISHNMVITSLVSLNINERFHYPRYFSVTALGQHPTLAFSKGLIDVLMKQTPAPKTIAIAAADQEFSKNNAEGARKNAEEAGLKIVYDKTYPPSTTDFAPVIRAAQATDADIFYAASYPPDSVGLVRAAHEIGYHAQGVRRRHGRAPGDQHPDAARAADERRRLVRGVGAGPDPGLPRRVRHAEALPGAGEGRRRRSAGLFPGARRLCLYPAPRRGGRGGEDARPGKARRLHPQPQILDRLRRRSNSAPTARPPTPTSARCRCSITTSPATT